MIDLMPSVEEYGLDLNLNGIIDTHIPGLRRDLFLQIGRQPEDTVDLDRFKLNLVFRRLRPADQMKGLFQNMPADPQIIFKIDINTQPDQVLNLFILVVTLSLIFPFQRSRCFYS